jgi:hypothetical protein
MALTESSALVRPTQWRQLMSAKDVANQVSYSSDLYVVR